MRRTALSPDLETYLFAGVFPGFREFLCRGKGSWVLIQYIREGSFAFAKGSSFFCICTTVIWLSFEAEFQIESYKAIQITKYKK